MGITDLRIRGMWHIENPNKIFDYLYDYDESKSFQLIALMRKEKYNSMPKNDREIIENMDNIKVRDIKIKNPNNPVVLIDGVILVFAI